MRTRMLFSFSNAYAMFTKQQAQATWNILILKICRCRKYLFFIHSFVGWLCSAFSIQRSHKRRLKHDFCLQVFFFYFSFILNHDIRYQRSSIYIVPLVTESIPFCVQRIMHWQWLQLKRLTFYMFGVRWYLRKKDKKDKITIFHMFMFMLVFMHTRRMSMHVLLWMDNYLKFRSCLFSATYIHIFNIYSVALMSCCSLPLLFFGVELNSQISTASRFNISLTTGKFLLFRFSDSLSSIHMLIHQFCIEKVHHLALNIFACIFMALNSKLLYSDSLSY